MTNPYLVTLDLAGILDKAGLMDRSARALELPDWFGRNWDALADSLADPSVWPPQTADRALLVLVTGWRAYARRQPQEWVVAQEVFTEASEREPRLTVALALG
jgi:hypothetical protein